MAATASACLREYLEAGAIGTVTEVHSWQDQRYGTRIRHPDAPVPQGVAWDEWLGPTPAIPYRPGLHPSVGGQNDDTGVGEGWYQLKPYGTGLLLCVGAHVCDPPHWALQLKYPSTCECLETEGQTPDSWGSNQPARLRVPPARAPHGEVLLVRRLPANPNVKGSAAWTLIRPALADEVQKKFGETCPGGGTLFVGDKGILYCNIFGGNPHIVDPAQHKATPVPEVKYPRIPWPSKFPGGFQSQADYMRACLEGGEPPCSNIPDVSGPYIEGLAGGRPGHAGRRRQEARVDAEYEVHQHAPEMNQFVKPEYRPGWGL